MDCLTGRMLFRTVSLDQTPRTPSYTPLNIDVYSQPTCTEKSGSDGNVDESSTKYVPLSFRSKPCCANIIKIDFRHTLEASPTAIKVGHTPLLASSQLSIPAPPSYHAERSYIYWSVFNILFCFFFLSIAAVVASCQTQRYIEKGEFWEHSFYSEY